MLNRNETAINFKVPPDLAEHLRHIARLRSLEERRSVSVGSLVREAVEGAYPRPQNQTQDASSGAQAPESPRI